MTADDLALSCYALARRLARRYRPMLGDDADGVAMLALVKAARRHASRPRPVAFTAVAWSRITDDLGRAYRAMPRAASLDAPDAYHPAARGLGPPERAIVAEALARGDVDESAAFDGPPRRCVGCGDAKRPAEFRPTLRGAAGVRSRCRACERAAENRARRARKAVAS